MNDSLRRVTFQTCWTRQCTSVGPTATGKSATAGLLSIFILFSFVIMKSVFVNMYHSHTDASEDDIVHHHARSP